MPKNILLRKNDLHDSEIIFLAGDASFRKYYRVKKTEDGCSLTYVLMDAPPDKEDIKPFLHIARHLNIKNLSPPKIIDYDLDNGLILMEDLQDDLYNSVLTDDNEEMLYEHAIDVLVHLFDAGAEFAGVPHYTDELFLQELELFTDWYLDDITPQKKDEFLDLWRGILPLAREVPECLVLRDYHADNLLWLPEREGVKKVGLLDFQDAVIGSVTYDIASLLEDARRDVSPEIADKMIARYLSATKLDKEKFMTSYAIMAAQRNIKIVGIFNRLAKRDDKPQYLDYLPRVFAYLNKDLEHPVLAEVKKWISEHTP